MVRNHFQELPYARPVKAPSQALSRRRRLLRLGRLQQTISLRMAPILLARTQVPQSKNDPKHLCRFHGARFEPATPSSRTRSRAYPGLNFHEFLWRLRGNVRVSDRLSCGEAVAYRTIGEHPLLLWHTAAGPPQSDTLNDLSCPTFAERPNELRLIFEIVPPSLPMRPRRNHRASSLEGGLRGDVWQSRIFNGLQLPTRRKLSLS